MIRRRVVLAFASAIVVPLVLVCACVGVNLPWIASKLSPEHGKLVDAITTLVDTLGRGEYAAAAALICADADEGHDEAALRAEFEPHPRPWKRSVTYSGYGDDSGDANLDLTPAGRAVVKYTFDLKKLPDGSWQVCDVSRGSTSVDVN